jgi:hypothetical protein
MKTPSYESTEVIRPKGINKDLSPYELPLDIWSDGKDVHFRRNRAERAFGYNQDWTVLDDATDFVINPLHVHFYTREDSYNLWHYASESAIYKTDGNSVVNVSKGSTSGTDPVAPYNASWTEGFLSETGRWTSCDFNSLLVFNNRFDHPQVNMAYTQNVRQPFIDLPNWGVPKADSIPADDGLLINPEARANIMRSHKNYLIAMDIFEAPDATNEDKRKRHPSRVWWSSPAALGDIPPSWDAFSPTEQAGYYDLAETADRIVDGKSLGDYFIIYKENSVWMMQFTGGPAQWSFRKLFGTDSGCLGKECITEFDGKHFVMTYSGAYVHNSATKEEVMEKWVKDEFYNTVDPIKANETKVVADVARKEIWVYFITTESPNGWADKALIWNWDVQEWSIKSLNSISFIAPGRSERGIKTVDKAFRPDERNIMLADYPNKGLYTNETGNTYAGATINGVIERQGIELGDNVTFKELTGISLNIETPAVWTIPTTVDVSIYTQELQGGPITKVQTTSFNAGTDRYIDCHAVGRWFGIKIEGIYPWTLTSYSLHWKPLGTL